jgi:hypothetical protein
MKQNTLYGFLFLLAGSIFSQTNVAISGSIEWERMELTAAVTVDLGAIGIRLPTGRIHAEEVITDEYPHLVRPYLLSIPVDSSTTLGDLFNQGEISLQGTDTISLSARKIAPSLSIDLTVMSSQYTLNLYKLSTSLIRHSRPKDTIRVLLPTQAASYTGIIIIANEALPVHGRNTASLTVPCIFPKIWDTKMNLIYERNMIDPETVQSMVKYVSPDSIFRPTPSGLEENLAKLVGSNPLRIIARGVFGIRPTDPIIDYEDALLIVSSENNRRLLQEGKVAIVINNKVLRNSF